jgi:O-antigen/teichoic acid export membrane protein
MKLQLARNAVSNLLGALVPALVALGTVPLVVKGLGNAGYGVYSLVTAIVGYFAVIDINVTAGSVKFIAQFNARRDSTSVGATISFGIMVYALLGAIGALGIYCGARYLVTEVFSVPPALADEAVATLKLAALGFFIGQLQNYLQSVPQALMRYDVSSRIEMLFGVVVPLLTVLVLMRGYGLFEVILLRVGASAVHCLVLWRSIVRLLPGLAAHLGRPGRAIRRELLGFSAWSFLSRFASLSNAYADKLIIGALAGVTALAWFTVASALASRVLGLTYRLSGVIFPAASALSARGELARLDSLYLKATRYVVFLNAAMLVLLAVFSEKILLYWMNPEFARHGAVVLAVMAASQFVDSLTSLPSLVNDGMGQPRVSGLFALARAGAGLLIVYAGTAAWGINGAAWGHLLASTLFSAAFIAYVHGRTVPTTLRRLLLRSYAPTLYGALGVALCAGVADRLLARTATGFVFLLAATSAVLFAHGTLFVLDKDDRSVAWTRVKACWGQVQGS